jgi:hypothetical protein
MKIVFSILLFVCFIPFVFGQKKEKKTEIFRWGNIGSIKVPKGFTQDYSNYREGHFYTLNYEDKSFIQLHRGGMIRFPLLQEDRGFILGNTENFEDKTLRCGKRKNTELYWCEVNYKRKENIAFPPNLTFVDVKKEKLELFMNALKSFRCLICEVKIN